MNMNNPHAPATSALPIYQENLIGVASGTKSIISLFLVITE